MIHVDGDAVWFEAYRDVHDGVYDYDDIFHYGALTATPTDIQAGDASWPSLAAGNRPNPFNPATTISFEVSAAGPVALAVYDVDGRLVRTLLSDVRGPGSYEIPWDGTDVAGRAVASGIYFYRLTTAGGTGTGKMSLLR